MAFLGKSKQSTKQPVYALFGDEDFLRKCCRAAIVNGVLGDADPEFAVSVYSGDHLDFSTVRNDLDTIPFLSPTRLVIVESADSFVTENRPALERYLDKPSKVGVLILELKSFPETTKLAKAMPDGAKVNCKAPYTNKLPEWCVTWCKTQHNVSLDLEAAKLLVDLVGPQMGLLAAELAKVTTAVGAEVKVINPAIVDKYVSRSREANVFHILDAIGESNAAKALTLFEETILDGAEPLAVLGAITFQLRKLAAIERHLKDSHSIGSAMDLAGVPQWPQARLSAEKQVRHLGRRRLSQITGWLCDVNLGLKGGSYLPPELQLERLIVNLAKPRT